MATNFGVDTSCTTDVGLVDVLVSDPRRLIGERVIRRLTTPRGALALIGGNPDAGFDVRQYVKKKMSPADLSQGQTRVAAEAQKDEAVQSASVAFTFSSGVLTIQVDLISAAGPLSLVLPVANLSAAQVIT